mmetsp:Transcript_68589/g.143067  ORF Transcript_68589/g.143067 Transcript_68589/m.143067 type:complete len:232 (+) Transcript_68589:2942-3637(+)
MPMVMSMYGSLIALSSSSCSSTSPCARGAARSTPEMYWLLILPDILMVPAGRPLAAIWIGGQLGPSRYLMSHPCATRASTMSLMGRSFMRALPVTTIEPPSLLATVEMPVRKRALVPELPRYRSCLGILIAPPDPETRKTAPFSSHSNATSPLGCSCVRASMHRCVSSECSSPLMRQSPTPNTASGRTRLDTDFDPGTLTVPERGPDGTGVMLGEHTMRTISASTMLAFGS